MRRKLMFLCLALTLGSLNAVGQRVTGSISGRVLDPQGLAVPGASVTVTNQATGVVARELTSGPDGGFVVPDLSPADYKVSITIAGFKTYQTVLTVQVGLATPLTANLEIGETAVVLEVQSTAVNVDTTLNIVQGVVTQRQIDELPLNGRNFLDLAQLDPGVQTVDGGNFDPTKNQMVGVSVGGRSGRVTRIQIDGVDITDETVGTTVANVSNESIQEFGIAQSSLDPSTDVTSSGAVNIISRSGSNNFHGSGFFLARDADFAADQRLDKTSGPKPPFDRQNWGGRAGWYFLPDKWFWHVEYEQSSQDGQTITNVPEFPQFTGAFPVPTDETMASGRTDYTVNDRLSLFYRFIHNHNIGVTGFGGRGLAAFSNYNNTNIHVVGADIRGARWTHSIRYSFVNFNNFIQPANSQAGTPLALDNSGQPNSSGPVSVTDVLIDVIGRVTVGPNLLAPQKTFQNNNQTKYDGSYVFGRHTLRFGAEWNRIEQFVFASFFGNGPRVRASYNSTTRAAANLNGFGPGGDQNPLNFPVTNIRLGNGLGFFSEKPALGFPFGGTTNHRLGFYAHDTWKWTNDFTLNFGVRYVWHSALSNHDLPRVPLMASFDPSLAGRPRRDTDDWAPQAGFAWNVFGNGKTVIRGGAGLFYETNIFNNILFDRVVNIPGGIGNSSPTRTSGNPLVLDPATGAVLFDFTNDCTGLPNNNCFDQTTTVGAVLPFAIQAQGLFQTASQALTAGYPQPGVPPLFDVIRDAAGSVIDTRYETPYGIQLNIGVQHELRRNLVLSVDYVRNAGRHFNLVRDRNRIGAANTLDMGIAQAAMAATFADFGCNTGAVSTDVDCVIAAGGSISDFADNGLGAGSALDGEAFRGMNPNFRAMGIVEPIGNSLFQALQIRLRGDIGGLEHFGIRRLSTNITYQLGRFESTGADQDFLSSAGFNDRPTQFFGPAGLDRTSQVGVAFRMELPFNINISSTNRFQSPLARSLFLPLTTGGADEIFFSDLDGDGVTQDPLPGTNRGTFGRDVKAGDLGGAISAYNSTFAGTLGPAAVALSDAGLLTTSQLMALGATLTSVSAPPTAVVGNDAFWNSDLRVSWRYKVKEYLTLEPMAEVFNLFNISNFAAGSSILDGGPGDPNGTTESNRPSRVGQGSGSFAPGVQRAFQFGIRVSW